PDTTDELLYQGLAWPAAGGALPAATFFWTARAICDFFRDARFLWMTLRLAALSSFLAAVLYSGCSASSGPSSAAVKRFRCVLITRIVVLLRTRFFSLLRRFFLALLVCGIYPVSEVVPSLFS